MIHNLLNKLDKVKKTGADSYRACCPGHQGTNPTALAIRQVDDGRILLKCHRGCSIDEILGAIGMDMNDLFPDGAIANHAGKVKQAFNPKDVLAAMHEEASIIYLYGKDVANKKPVTDDQFKRVLLSIERIKTSMELCNAASR